MLEPSFHHVHIVNFRIAKVYTFFLATGFVKKRMPSGFPHSKPDGMFLELTVLR